MICRSCEPDIKAEINRLQAEGKPVSAIAIARKMFRETYSAGNYLLRDIPEELWTAAKHRAVDEGLSLRELILKALQEILRSGNTELLESKRFAELKKLQEESLVEEDESLD